jgi:hypothetical protein
VTDTAVVPATESEKANEPEETPDPLAHLADHFSPCKVCGKNWYEGPEADTHVFHHCWKCGCRPGQQVAAGVMLARPGLSSAEIQAELTAFKTEVVGEIRDLLKDFIPAKRQDVIDVGQHHEEVGPSESGS